MTKQQINEIGNWLQDENIAYFIESTGLICVQSETQFDEVDCILSDMGIEYTWRQDEAAAKYGNEFVAYITIK